MLQFRGKYAYLLCIVLPVLSGCFNQRETVSFSSAEVAIPVVLETDAPVDVPLYTNQQLVELTGTCSGSKLSLKSSQGSLTSPNCADGKWKLSLAGLAEGEHRVSITATDLYNNQSVRTVTLVVDRIPPVLSSAESPYLRTGASVSVAGSCATDVVSISSNLGTWVDRDCSDGTWALGLTDLTVGTHALSLSAVDRASNASQLNVSVIRFTGPYLAITAPGSGQDMATNQSPQTISGLCANVTELIASAGALSSENCSSNGTWSLGSGALNIGINTFTLTARDALGSESIKTITVTYDTTPPVLAITAPNGGANFATDEPTQTLSGTCGVDVMLLTASAGSLTNNCASAGTWSLNSGALSNGPNTFTVTARDAAGNFVSRSLTITSSYVLPSVAISFPNGGANYSTYKNFVILKGSCGATTDSITATIGHMSDDCGNGKWELWSDNLVQGANVIGISAKDAFGAAATASVTITRLAEVTDPLFQHSWHLSNTGQNNFAFIAAKAGEDMNVLPVYDEKFLGNGVIVAVSDSGLELAHEDLADNIYPGSRNYVSNPVAPFLGDPTDKSSSSTGDHGTSVAGLIAASKGNGKGSHGVAPNAYLVGYNFLSSAQSTAMLADQATGDVDIVNQSWGYGPASNCGNTPVIPPNATYTLTTRDGASGVLRDGKPIMYVKAAGNEYSSSYTVATKCGLNVPANYDPGNNYPWKIVVGAVNSDGVRASYSSVGSSVWISGFGGEYGYTENPVDHSRYSDPLSHPAMMTIDQTGCTVGSAGSNFWASLTNIEKRFIPDFMRMDYPNRAGTSNHPQNVNCAYTSQFNGTSAAAPTVSGVVALMLQAQPDLSVRDIKHILANTAVKANPTDPSWVTNQAGYKFSNRYGFGVVDAQAAVNMAKTYVSNLGAGNWASPVAASLNQAVAITDNSGTGAQSTIAVGANITVEQVRIRVSASHAHTGDLGVKLRSPSGTTSVLWDARSALNGTVNWTNFTLLSNAFYGESSQGDWQLEVFDSAAGTAGTLTSWSIEVYGR